jgi:hypothetical protein
MTTQDSKEMPAWEKILMLVCTYSSPEVIEEEVIAAHMPSQSVGQIGPGDLAPIGYVSYGRRRAARGNVNGAR